MGDFALAVLRCISEAAHLLAAAALFSCWTCTDGPGLVGVFEKEKKRAFAVNAWLSLTS